VVDPCDRPVTEARLDTQSRIVFISAADFSAEVGARRIDRAREGFREPAAAATPGDPPLRDGEVWVSAGPVSVAGHLTIPEHPVGVVVFAHGCDRKPLA